MNIKTGQFVVSWSTIFVLASLAHFEIYASLSKVHTKFQIFDYRDMGRLFQQQSYQNTLFSFTETNCKKNNQISHLLCTRLFREILHILRKKHNYFEIYFMRSGNEWHLWPYLKGKIGEL